MLSLENIIKEFAIFASLDLNEATKYSPICISATDSILKSLKQNVNIETNKTRLESISAVIAFYRYTLLMSAENCHNLKFGELQLSASSNLGLKSAEAIKDEYLLSATDLLEYQNIVFKQVD